MRQVQNIVIALVIASLMFGCGASKTVTGGAIADAALLSRLTLTEFFRTINASDLLM